MTVRNRSLALQPVPTPPERKLKIHPAQDWSPPRVQVDCLDVQLQELEEREKRSAAVHEASHAALFRHFGGLAQPLIWRNESKDPSEKSWLGRCYFLSGLNDQVFERGLRKQLGVIRPPKRWSVYVGLAGWVGEQMVDHTPEPWELEQSFWNADEGEVSMTDLATIGPRVTERDFATTSRYLQRCWTEVEREALSLLSYWCGEDAIPHPVLLR